MRNNPDQRTVDLRAKYRAKHGNDWWKDAKVKAKYDAEKSEIYRDDAPSKSKDKSKGKKKKPVITDAQFDAIVESGNISDEHIDAMADWAVNQFQILDRSAKTDSIFEDTSSNFGKFSEWLGEPQPDETFLTITRGEIIDRGKPVGGAQITASIDTPHGVSEWFLQTTGVDGEIYLSGSVNGEDFGSIFDVTDSGDLELLLEGFLNWALAAQTDGTFSIRGSMHRGAKKSSRKKSGTKKQGKSKESVVKHPKDKQAQKNAKQMEKLVEFLEKELKEPFGFAVTNSSDGSVEEIYVAPIHNNQLDEDISLGISDNGLRIFMNNYPEEDIQGYYSTLKGMKRDIRKFIRQAQELLGEEDVRDIVDRLGAEDEDDAIAKLTESKFQKKLSHFGRHPTGNTKKQLSATKAKKIAEEALEELGIEIGRWTSMYGGQGFGAKVKNRTLDGQNVRVVISMHADYWDVAFTEDKSKPKGLLSEVGFVYHFYAQKEFGDLVKLMANYYLGEDAKALIDDVVAMAQMKRLPKQVRDAFLEIQENLEELPDRYHNDTGLYYDHTIFDDGTGIALTISLNPPQKSGWDTATIYIKPNLIGVDIMAQKTRPKAKRYNLSSTMAVSNYIKKWIESYL